MQLPITVITDCRDDNAKSRVTVRLHSLFPGSPVEFVGVNDDLDAGGNLVDMLDGLDGTEGLILVNAAPRGGKHGTNWGNGSPFGAVTINGTLIVTTISGCTLSFADKLGLLCQSQVQVFDVAAVLESHRVHGRFSEADIDRITRTQFRSYEFAPRLAKWILSGHQMPFTPLETPIVQLPPRVWWVDNFGNCKLTILPADIDWQPGRDTLIRGNAVPCYSRLSEVPKDKAGIVVGSSGIDHQRFLELVVNGDSAARRFGLEVGTEIF